MRKFEESSNSLKNKIILLFNIFLYLVNIFTKYDIYHLQWHCNNATVTASIWQHKKNQNK